MHLPGEYVGLTFKMFNKTTTKGIPTKNLSHLRGPFIFKNKKRNNRATLLAVVSLTAGCLNET